MLTVRYNRVNTQALITEFMLNRANQLASNQPDLTRFLQDSDCGDLSANYTATEGSTNAGSVDDDSLKITGKGWLTGPYFVHKLSEQNVTFEGRLLYGETDNYISLSGPQGTYTDSFDSVYAAAGFHLYRRHSKPTQTTPAI